mgnify:CR=1 FL=1
MRPASHTVATAPRATLASAIPICSGGTAWVDKAIRRQAGDSTRFDRMLDEGWDE